MNVCFSFDFLALALRVFTLIDQQIFRPTYLFIFLSISLSIGSFWSSYTRFLVFFLFLFFFCVSYQCYRLFGMGMGNMLRM